MGYWPSYGYLTSNWTYPSSGYYWSSYYSPARLYDSPSYYSYTRVYTSEPDVDYVVDEPDVYYTENNYYVGGGAVGQAVDDVGIAALEPSTSTSGTVVIEPNRVDGRVEPTPSVKMEDPITPGGRRAEPEADNGMTPPEPTLVDLGNAAFNAGDYEEAVRFYVGAVLVDDSDAAARLFYGLAQFALGDNDLAAMALRRALDLWPELIEQPIDLRSLYPDIASFESHLDNLVKFVDEHASNRNALFVLGYVYYATAQPELAAITLGKLVDLEPEDALAARVRDAALRVIAAGKTASEP